MNLEIKNTFYHADCSHFRGDLPCKPHKLYNVKCDDCSYYNPKNDFILVIKLAAIGDVIRTTPLLHKLWEEHPKSNIWWITYSPDILPSSIDKILSWTSENLITLQAMHFSKIINLDKDVQACALTNLLSADEKIGYHLLNGKPAPINENAKHKFATGLFDDVNKANTKSYVEEIFEICDWKFEKQEYILDYDTSKKWNIDNEGMPIVGLNTGCGDRWVSRLWSDENWIALIRKLQNNDIFPLLLGGKQEDDKNKFYSRSTGAEYLGHYPLKDFISLVAQCDAVVSAVTMGMHLSVGLKKPLVLLNNIFNPHEFELYGRGEVVQPDKTCQCFFSPTCTNSEYKCMEALPVDKVFQAIMRSLKVKR